MIELADIKNIYFIGIGGIGMSALARYFKSREVKVSGYDKTATPLARQLESEGMLIHYTDDVNVLDRDAQIVVYTPAIPKNHAELNWYRDNEYAVVKRSDILQIITKDSFNICVAGTHGKTSISSMIGHILRHTGYGCNAFLGGIAVNYDSNFWSSNNNVCVVEADEYDRSFLKLNPDIAIVTAMDADHLDIYGTVENMQDAFVQFASQIKPNGLLIRKLGLGKLKEASVSHQLTYELLDNKGVQPNIYAENIRTKTGGYLFDAIISGEKISDIELGIGGLHNIENALAAVSVAKILEIEDGRIKSAVAAFKGVKRRFEYVVKDLDGAKPQVVIDDYAHHPEELKALINSAQKLFPEMRSTVIFQPHLFSRTKDLAEGFAEALDMADEVILLPIYPARELPMEGVTSALILDKMKHAKVRIMPKEEWIKEFDKNNIELLITAGAGDIDTIVPIIKKEFEN